MLTGGEDDEVFLSSSVLYPGGCSVPSMESDRYGHVTFLTQDTNPRIAICGGLIGSYNRKRDCLVLRNGGWLEGELGNMPDARSSSASARLDAGVFILGGSGETRPNSSAYFLKARVLVVQTPQTILNFPQKDCLRMRKVSRLHCLHSY